MELLAGWLDQRHIVYIRTREPGGTPLGRELRSLLFERADLEITPLAEAFLFQADRAQHFSTLVLPALQAGTLVITDRCFDASIAYQGFARDVGPELVARLSLIATRGYIPDLTILLDLAPSEVKQRVNPANDASGLRATPSRFDSAQEAFHLLVQQGFRLLARAQPARIKIVDASQPAAAIHREIVDLLEPLL
jgi:dTMP kinase